MIEYKNKVYVLRGGGVMTMQENANLVEIFDKLGISAGLGDFILGVEGRISTDEAAERLLRVLREKLKSEVK